MARFPRLFLTKGKRGHSHQPGVATVAEFERVFKRERALAERGARHFSLVVFEPSSDEPRVVLRLTRAIGRRLRDSDVLGRIDWKRYAVILAATDDEGAWIFADRVLGDLTRDYLPADVRVYSDQDHTNEHDAAGADRAAATPRTEAPVAEPTAVRDDSAEDERAPADLLEGAAAHLADLTGGAASAAMANGVGPSGDYDLSDVRTEMGRAVHDLEDLFLKPTPPQKRALDVFVAAAALVALLPLFAAVAVAIKLTSRGPVFFKQTRAGVGGKPFAFYKFRSMFVDAEARKQELMSANEADGPVFKMRHDPRVTSIGRILRRFSLDELPQLWNVLKGDMSLVGPRPPTMDEVPAYARWHRRRLQLKGGLTCHWQVSGRSDVPFEEWMRMDARYSREANLGTDIKLLAKTARAVISGKGAY